MNINQDNDILALLNGYNLLPTRKDKRSLIQSYYSRINIDNSLCSTTTCSTRPMSHVELLVDKVYQLSEIYLTNQLEQAFIKAKLGKVKPCDYDNTMNVHYWVQHLTIFYQDIISFSNTCSCIDDATLNKFKDKYAIDCILNNIACKKDNLALLYNQIYKVVLSKIPKCDTKLSLSWDDEYYCVCDAEQLLPIVINSIIPTYRTLQIDWTHTATGILYLVEVLDYETQELVASDITSNKQIEIFGLVPNKEYTVRISASNCKSTVSTSQNQETLPIFITVNLIDNRDNQISTDYNISFLGTRQLDEDELFVLDFSFLNILQQTLDVITPNQYSYFSKIILSNIESSQTIFINNETDSKLTKLDYYLGLLTQGRFKIQPLINTTIDIYLDEISYVMNDFICSSTTLNYTSFIINNSEENKIIILPNTATAILNDININTSTLFISSTTVNEILDNTTVLDSDICCKDSELLDLNLTITNIQYNALTVNFTPNQGVATLTITRTNDSSIVFNGTIAAGTGIFNILQSVGLTATTEYLIELTITNCTGSISDSVIITTETSVLLTINNTGAKGNVRLVLPFQTEDINSGDTLALNVSPGMQIEIQVGIVDLDTGTLNSNDININYLSNNFPSRIQSITSGGSPLSESTIPTIPDDNTVKKARKVVFIMPNLNYTVDVLFRELNIVDVDFEDPTCTTLGIGNIVDTIRDTKNQTAGSYQFGDAQGTLISNRFVSRFAYYQLLLFGLANDTIFAIGSIDEFTLAGPGAEPSLTGVPNNVKLNPILQNPLFAASGEENRIGIYRQNPRNSGLPSPDFTFDNSYLTRKLLFVKSPSRDPLLKIDNGQTYLYPNASNISATTTILMFGGSMTTNAVVEVAGQTSMDRVIVTEKLTQDEYNLFISKIQTKYGI